MIHGPDNSAIKKIGILPIQLPLLVKSRAILDNLLIFGDYIKGRSVYLPKYTPAASIGTIRLLVGPTEEPKEGTSVFYDSDMLILQMRINNMDSPSYRIKEIQVMLSGSPEVKAALRSTGIWP